VSASYDEVPHVPFIALLCQAVLRVLPKTTTNCSRMSLFTFSTILTQGTFETALVSGGGCGLYIMSFGFLLLAKYNEENRKVETGTIT